MELENEVFLSWPFWIFFQEKLFFCFISMKTRSPFIWGIIYFCTMYGFSRILEKTSFQLICTRLYILSWIKSPFIWIKCHIPVIHKFCCGTKTAGKTQAATWGSSSKDLAFFRRMQSWKSCLTFSKLMKYSLGFCWNSWSGFSSAAKSTWFSSWIGWIGINLIVKFPLPLDLQYNTGSFKKLDLSYITPGPPRRIWARQGPIFYPKFFWPVVSYKSILNPKI